MWKDPWVCALYNHFRDRLWQGQNSWMSLNPRMSLVSSICSKDQAEHVTGISASNKGAIKNLTASNLMLTLWFFFRGFWLLKASLEVSILALKWGRKAQEMSLAMATLPHSSKCSPNEYFSKLAIFILLLAGRKNCVAKISLVALIHNRIPIGDI